MVNFTRTINDGVGTTDFPQSVDHSAVGQDTIFVTDSGQTLIWLADGIETLTITEEVVLALTTRIVIADNVGITDVPTTAMTYLRLATDDVSVTETVTRAGAWIIVLEESISVDDYGSSVNTAETMSDAVGVADVVSPVASEETNLELLGIWEDGAISPLELLGLWEDGMIKPLSFYQYDRPEGRSDDEE